jgi:GT2 family glycosyltransferase
LISAVAIINWNSGARLRPCVESLLATSPNTEIVIVDNASEDGSIESVLDFRAHASFIRNSTNRGFAAAVNQAVANTTTAYVLILNPDVRVTSGAVDYLEEFMNAHPQAGAIGGNVNASYPARNLPNWVQFVRQNLGIGKKEDSDIESREPRPVDQPAAAALMIRREAFDDIGGFDERFHPAWYEDVDFCRRLKTAGWPVFFAPEAKFEHEGGYSAKAMGAEAFANAYYRNQLRYAEKHFGGVSTLAVRLSIALGMLGRIVARPTEARACWKVLLGALGSW